VIAVELRHESWFADEHHCNSTLAFMRERQFCHVVVDEPQGLPGSIPLVWEVTHPDLAVFRLHGRNAEMWNRKGLATASERFDYDYSREELSALMPRLLDLAQQAATVHVICNVNREDQGVRAARTVQELLSESPNQQDFVA
jgi:uncharacterized protein YecE (DUF72 family)